MPSYPVVKEYREKTGKMEKLPENALNAFEATFRLYRNR